MNQATAKVYLEEVDMRPWFFKALMLCLLVSDCSCARAQSRSATWAVDVGRPYFDLVFDHVGPRSPARVGEKPEGLWLRLLNNSTVPVEISVASPAATDKQMIVDHEVVKVPEDFVIEHGPVNSEAPVSCSAGYNSGDVSSRLRIEPTKVLSFSVPADHVTRNCFVRIEVSPLMPRSASGRQPRTFVEFFWTDVPYAAQVKLTQLESK